MVQMKTVFAASILVCGVLSACTEPPAPATYVGVMIDNHEIARPYQRGLEKAVFVQEQFVEGWITRFEAVFDLADLPSSVGPVRSVRSYFIDGTSPIVSAIFHAGGSPDALAMLAESGGVQSFNALRLDRYFDYDDVAPAPHHRFLLREDLLELAERMTKHAEVLLPLFPVGDFESDEPATMISVDYRSPVHNVSYSYDAHTQTYVRHNRGVVQASLPANILFIETDAAVTGELGRLSVRMTGSGNALLFRDGGLAKGTWKKSGNDTFFSLSDRAGNEFVFHEGQTWMIMVDDLERLSW